ncbi:hypothetical protein VIBNISFn27_560026 [Vibrio nigripulchritudo SFn27]|nr:hypothetical protein VIBNIBLFn1_930026 [Vibrio nigripulchritudo BLFn1]CCN89093.1 hypothetical protein VIBNISFn27_560026 [Vibrio nigripulchritudo SFn27]CCO50898.1 hypothetical protein VIBNIWn13_1050026 [Vibrio nigripulchritudo Wn13]
MNNGTTILSPIILQREDHSLEGFDIVILHNQVRAILLYVSMKITIEYTQIMPCRVEEMSPKSCSEVAFHTKLGTTLEKKTFFEF